MDRYRQIQDIAEFTEPTESQTCDLPAFLADDGGVHERVPLTEEQVKVLKAKHLIFYCGVCTRTTLDIGNDYEAREYHPRDSLYDADDPEAYLAWLLSESKGEGGQG